MLEVIMRPDAAADIELCADYTIGEWGHEQALQYVAELRRAIEGLATSALRHPLIEEIQPGLRRKRSGMHNIYYVTSKERVEVLKVLHVQRDPGLHLKMEGWSGEE
jgi:plasmid stabilization system protein ParE